MSLVVRIAAVDDGVACLQQIEQRSDRFVGRRAGRHHHPQSARRLQFPNERVERCSRLRAVLFNALARFRIEIEPDHAMAAAQQPQCHVGAHAPEPDHREFHRYAECSMLVGSATHGCLRCS